MTKTATSTGLVRVEYHGQVWFDNPGYTEVVFQRLHIEHEYGFISIKDISGVRRDGVRNNTKYDEDC